MKNYIIQTIKKNVFALQVSCNKVIRYIQTNVAYSVWRIMSYDRDIQFVSIGYIAIISNDLSFIK